MSRPTGPQLTGAGFTQVGSTNQYTKTTGTATAVVDITGSAAQGFWQIGPATDTYVQKADFQVHLATLGSLGVLTPAVEDVQSLSFYGQTL